MRAPVNTIPLGGLLRGGLLWGDCYAAARGPSKLAVGLPDDRSSPLTVYGCRGGSGPVRELSG
jgi:hypothetical protein